VGIQGNHREARRTLSVASQTETEAAGITMTVTLPLNPGDTEVAPERALSASSAD
jgi:hypothetical protein